LKSQKLVIESTKLKVGGLKVESEKW